MELTIAKSEIYNFQNNSKATAEQLWLMQIYRGEKSAFWEIWQQYQDYLYRRCWTWMGGNSTDAQEALSQAMLKAWYKLPKHADRISDLKAWLTRMTHNLCVDLHRKRQRESKSIDYLESIADTEHSALRGGDNSPESEILGREIAVYIRQAVNALPARLHQPFTMRFDWEMSHLEIAKRLDISPDNARKRIQQAREILQKQLEPYFSGTSHYTQAGFQANDTLTQPSDLKEHPLYSIDYRITVSCLETLPPTWCISNPLGWN